MIFITSDHHFGHWAKWVQDTRPFESVEEMDTTMIKNWNRVVGDGDVVYHLGDFTLSGRRIARTYLKRLTGRVSVLGNKWHHDKRWLRGSYRTASGFQVSVIDPMHVLELDEYSNDARPLAVVLTHFPFHEWDRKHYGAIQLHGHTHLNTPDLGPRSVNMCVEHWDYTPVPLDVVVKRALARRIK